MSSVSVVCRTSFSSSRMERSPPAVMAPHNTHLMHMPTSHHPEPKQDLHHQSDVRNTHSASGFHLPTLYICCYSCLVCPPCLPLVFCVVCSCCRLRGVLCSLMPCSCHPLHLPCRPLGVSLICGASPLTCWRCTRVSPPVRTCGPEMRCVWMWMWRHVFSVFYLKHVSPHHPYCCLFVLRVRYVLQHTPR